MKVTAQQLNPEEYILAVLSPEDRSGAALRIAQEAFKHPALTLDDVESVVRKVRRRLYARGRKRPKVVIDIGKCLQSWSKFRKEF